MRTTLMQQQDCEQAMPLPKLLHEVLALEHTPDARELLVERARPLHFATADGTHPLILTAPTQYQTPTTRRTDQ